MFESFTRGKSFTYEIQGDPVPLARHRNNNGRIYDSQKHIKLAWGINLKNQHGDKPPLIGPLCLECHFYIQIPESATKKRKAALADKPHVSVPDLDNLIKFCSDASQNVIFVNDCQIVSIQALKFYSPLAKTKMIFTELQV